jgi:hypothetical protein
MLFGPNFVVEKRLCLKGLKIEDASEIYGITSSSPPNLTQPYPTKFVPTQSGAICSGPWEGSMCGP